jgi:hypothetical protein
MDDLPDWLPAWCLDHLGGEPAGVLFRLQQVSTVLGLRLADGRDVVVKARADDGRAVYQAAAEQPDLATRVFGVLGGSIPTADVYSDAHVRTAPAQRSNSPRLAHLTSAPRPPG